MDITVVIIQLIQLFILIGIGYLLGKTSLFRGVFVQQLTNLVLNLTMPCMILSSVMNSIDAPALPLKDIIIAMFILVIILPVAAFLMIRRIKTNQGLYLFMIMYPNVGFIGFPLMQSIFGSEAILATAIINMGFNLSLFTLGIVAINYGENKLTSFDLKKIFSPGAISSILAVLIYTFKLTFPYVIVEPINSIGMMTTPLAMLVIGATLSVYHLKDIFSDYTVYLFTLLIDLIIPILFYPVILLFIKDSMIRGITLIILAMPVANGAVLFARSNGQDEFLAAKTVFISTMLAIFTIPSLVYMFLL